MRSGGSMHVKSRGSVLPLVMLAMVLLMVTGIGALRIGQATRMRAIHTAHVTAAQAAADAGMTKALSEMTLLLESDSSADLLIDAVSGGSLSYFNGEYGYEVTKTTFDGTDAYEIESVGSYGTAEQRVVAVVAAAGPFDRGVSMQMGISLKSDAVVEAYNNDPDDDTALIGTMGTDASMIRIGPGAAIKGDIAIGYGGDPDVVVDYIYRSDIEGEIFTDTVAFEMPDVTVPDSLSLLPSQGALSAAGTVADSGKYSSINIGQADIVTIDGPVSLYVTGDVILDNSAQIQINDTNPDASLTLYMGGDLSLKNGGTINNLSKDARKVTIYGLPTTENMILHTAGSFYGAIYAPDADIKAMNSIDFYGSIVGKSFLQAAKGNVYFDASLPQYHTTSPGRYLAVKRWLEE